MAGTSGKAVNNMQGRLYHRAHPPRLELSSTAKVATDRAFHSTLHEICPVEATSRNFETLTFWYAVTIKLTPLGRDEEDNHRVIKLNDTKKEADIGRASKNAHKGLLAGPTNAWFDYPILSRTHAKFTFSSQNREVYVKDCGSTHGTFLKRQRLETGVPYTVTDGEVITFGQRVTSGAVTYPAKDFRVQSKWDPSSSTYSGITSRMLPLGFCVPEEEEEDDNEELEHILSLEQSREASVEITQSRSRIYSVLSDDDETDSETEHMLDTAFLMQDDVDNGEGSTVTTPDHGVGVKTCDFPDVGVGASTISSAQGGVRSLNLKGPSLPDLLSKPKTLGSSQQDPIDLEGISAEVQDIPDTESEDDDESEDDGPEILPTYQPQRSLAQSPECFSNDRKPRAASPFFKFTESPEHRPHGQEARATSPQFISYSPELRPAIFQLDSAQSPQDRPHSPEPVPAPTSKQLYSATSPQLCNGPQLVHSQYKAPVADDADTILDTEDQLKHTIYDTQARVSRERGLPGQSYPHLGAVLRDPKEEGTARLNSPDYPVASIAGATDGFDSEDDDGFDQDDDFSDFDPEKDINRDESFPRVRISQLRSTYPSAVPPHINMRSLTMGGAQPTPKVPATSNKFSCPNHGHNISMSEGIDVSQPSHNNPLPSVLRAPSPSDAALAKTNWKGAKSPYDLTVALSYSDLMISEPPSKPYNERPFSNRNRHQSQDQPSQAWEGGASLRTLDPPTPPNATYGTHPPTTETIIRSINCPEPRKVSDRHSSKLNISSIVNAPFEGTSRPHKRRADEMSSDSEFVHRRVPTQPPPPSPYSANAGNTETRLADAQPMDTLPPVEVSAISQGSIAKPAIALTSTAVMAKAESAETPARKKARTSKSSTGGIGKFVSGVCVGLVGALAAFVATIPASVREEALHELSNGA
ncbi:hypothetical protein N7G274_002351 [Stereocaulon virgatum]|uniref:FHA domain-containing protein n=1 Tax=Stereocaulon virgatum TaxID=373712 RepID=A0ABR4AHL2_9LECA